MLFQLKSGFEIDLNWIDEGHQPSKQLLMNGMVGVGVEGGLVGELHDSAEFVSLRPRRDVDSNQGFEKAWDLSLKCSDFCNCMLFLVASDCGLPAKGKCVDDHAASVYRAPLE